MCSPKRCTLPISWHCLSSGEENGALQQAKLGVTVESEEHLLPPEQFQKLNADAIIECLISGKTPSQWIDQNNGRRKSSGTDDAAIESLRSVDTSSFLLYRVRRFDALTGMSQTDHANADASRCDPLPTVERPIWPSFVGSVHSERRDDDAVDGATLDDEHRLFLLAEILLTVAYLQPRVTHKVKGKERQAIEGIFGEAIQQLQQLVDGMIERVSIPTNLTRLSDRVQVRSTHRDAGATEVQHVD